MDVSLLTSSHSVDFPPRSGILARLGRAKCASLCFTKLSSMGAVFAAAILQFDRHSSRRDDVYNILWAVVFGFATLNILSLAARRFEPHRRGLSFGELLAVLIVLLSIVLLGWELLSVFRIFPIKLSR
jgi:hypothetical protein